MIAAGASMMKQIPLLLPDMCSQWSKCSTQLITCTSQKHLKCTSPKRKL
jgi:hypothetical protein